MSSKILGFATKKFIRKEYENEFEGDRIKDLRIEKDANQKAMDFINTKIEQMNRKNRNNRCASGNLSDYVYVRTRPATTTYTAKRKPVKVSASNSNFYKSK